jgi:hypothetical protein
VPSGIYTLAPTSSGYVFTPSSLAKRVASAALTNENFAATPTSAPGYSITGIVGGAISSGVVMILNGTNVGEAATDMSGAYGFFGLASGTYTVSASAPGYAFSATKTITIGTTDSTANDFTATAAHGSGVTVVAVAPLPPANVGKAYSQSVIKSVTGGIAPYRYQTDQLTAGAPPLGMVLDPNGTLTGTPAQQGTYSFNVCAVDSVGDITAACAPTSITVAPAVTNSTPAPAGTSWVYHDGAFDWPGDYSFVAVPDYKDTTGAPLSGAYDIKVTLTSAWGGWLPYALNWNFNSAGYTKLTFALKPTVENQKWNVYFVKVGDVPVGIYIDPTLYGPAPKVGQWATYTIPLSTLGVLGAPIYKFCIHDETGLSNNTWYVDDVGFVP